MEKIEYDKKDRLLREKEEKWKDFDKKIGEKNNLSNGKETEGKAEEMINVNK